MWNDGASRSRSYVQNVINSIGQTGFDFEGDVLSIVFFAKYDLAEGDTARLLVRFYDGATYKGYQDFRMFGSTDNEFTKHSVPIFWFGSRTPSRVQIYIYSNENNAVEGNGYLIMDDIHFENLGKRAEDIDNFGFENWTNIGVDYPEAWRSYDLLVWDTYNYFLSEPAVVRSTDAYSGNYSMEVGNYLSGSTPRGSYVYLGNENGEHSSPAFRIYNRYKYLQGYYKYHDGDGTDSGRIIYRTYKNGASHSYSSKYFNDTDGDWKFFTMPINYYNDSTPDSASIIAYSTFGSPVHEMSYFLLDDLDLVMAPVSTGIDEINLSVGLYPNPVIDLLQMDLKEEYTVELTDLFGRRIQQQYYSQGKHALDLSGISTGIYYLKFSNKDRRWKTKILKQ